MLSTCVLVLLFSDFALLLFLSSKGLFKCLLVDANGKGLYFERWNTDVEPLVQWASAFPNGTLVRLVNHTVRMIPKSKRM